MPIPVALIAALAPSIIGGITSLLGKGKGKEIPRESAATAKARQQMMSYMMPGGQPRQMTPFTGTMPGVQKGFYDALNMMSMFYGKKPYKMPKRRGMGTILGLPTTGGFNPYAGGGVGGPGGGGGGMYRGEPNPWARYGGAPMPYRPLEEGGGPGGPPMAFQYGGIVTRPTRAILGEAGPEAVVPLGGTQPPTTFPFGEAPAPFEQPFGPPPMIGGGLLPIVRPMPMPRFSMAPRPPMPGLGGGIPGPMQGGMLRLPMQGGFMRPPSMPDRPMPIEQPFGPPPIIGPGGINPIYAGGGGPIQGGGQPPKMRPMPMPGFGGVAPMRQLIRRPTPRQWPVSRQPIRQPMGFGGTRPYNPW